MPGLSGCACLDGKKPCDLDRRMKMTKLTIIALMTIFAFNLTARADQPHMRRALEHLRAARAELESAEHNKGGWRIRAIENTNRAIAETERGMAGGR